MSRKNRQKRVHGIGCQLFAAILAGLFSAAEISTAAEMSNQEKINFIDETIEAKIKEAQDENALPEILAAVAKKIPLDAGETPKSAAIIEQQKRKARQKYPLNDEELNAKFRQEAGKIYPVYKPGDKVKVVYKLAGKPFVVSGPFYRSNSTHIWIGPKKIPRSAIPSDQQTLFDAKLNDDMRRKYILKQMDDYHRALGNYEQKLLKEQQDNIESVRNKIKISGKWLDGRTAVEQRYENTLELKKIISYCSQPEIDPQTLKKQFNIDLYDTRMLPKIRERLSTIPGADKLFDFLDKSQQTIARKIIEDGLACADAAETQEEKLKMLRKVISSCPKHTPELQEIRTKLREAETQYVKSMIARAKDSDSANEAAKILDAAIAQCPDAPNTNEAVALYQKYKKKHRQELAEKQQAELRESKERGSAGSGVTIIYDNTSKRRICADCSGRGFAEVYHNGRYYKRRCSSCNGTGNAGIYGDYIDSRGGRQRSVMEQNMGRMLGVP